MELYAERLRLAAIAEAEARGESLWTPFIPEPAGHKIVFAWSDLPTHARPSGQSVWSLAQNLVQRSTGNPERLTISEAFTYFRAPEFHWTYLEAAYAALKQAGRESTYFYAQPRHAGEFERKVNSILNAHRISVKMVEGTVVSLESEELHAAVVEPVIFLLHGHPTLAAAQDAYLKALKEIQNNDAADAITDAGTALQETLVALGCSGNALGPLVTSARKMGLIAPHDQALGDGIIKILDWASANRSQRGDAHSSTAAELSDAWLMVHVVGALIVRLAESAGLQN